MSPIHCATWVHATEKERCPTPALGEERRGGEAGEPEDGQCDHRGAVGLRGEAGDEDGAER